MKMLTRNEVLYREEQLSDLQRKIRSVWRTENETENEKKEKKWLMLKNNER